MSKHIRQGRTYVDAHALKDAEPLLETYMLDEEQKKHAYETKDNIWTLYDQGRINLRPSQTIILLQAALLHDLMEDTNIEKDELVETVGSDVTALVSALTREKNETYEDYLARLYKKYELILKIADLKANIARAERRLESGEVPHLYSTEKELKYAISRKKVALKWMEDRLQAR